MATKRKSASARNRELDTPRSNLRIMTMVDLTVLPGFIAVIMLFLVPPGPDMAYMLAVGLQGGRRAALAAIVGIGTGMTIYAAAVVAGIGQIAKSYPLLFDALKLVGAA